MDVVLRSLFLDCFRTADLDPEIKDLAARGLLAPRAHDQLGILMWLCGDQDPATAHTAESTIAALPRARLTAFLARADVPDAVRAFFATRGVMPSAVALEEPDPAPFVVEGAVEDPVPAPEQQGADSLSGTPPPEAAVDEASSVDEVAADETQGERQGSVTERIANMTVPERLSLAMKGSREERAVLVRDSNKLVSTAVIASPKLTESEVESIARMANVSDEILRIIAMNRSWTKNYAVVSALAKNPKTPVALSMNLLPRLHEKDLKALSTNRNIPDVLRMSARTKLVFEKR